MIPKEDLEQMYCNEKMSMIEISEVVGVSDRTVCNWIKKYGIVSRRNSKLHLISIIKPSKKELENMYWNRGMSMHDIAEKVGVSSGTVVFNWMKEYRIKSRTNSESLLTNASKPSRERLEKMYRNENMSAYEIAKNIGVSHSTVYHWMLKYGIDTRTISESHIGKFTGKNARNWHGGISFEPYCEKFNNTFKEAVRERDDYTCQLCGYEQNGQKLDVHHIHYDKANCYPDVVTLCRSCNVKVNSDRDYWEEYFEDLLIENGMLGWSLGG